MGARQQRSPRLPAPCPLPVPDTAHAGTHVHPKASVYLGVSPAAVGGTFLAPATPALPMYNYLQPPTPARVPRGGSEWAGCPEHLWVPVSTGGSSRFYPNTAPSPSLPHPKTLAEPPPWPGHLGPVSRVPSPPSKTPGRGMGPCTLAPQLPSPGLAWWSAASPQKALAPQ